MAQRGRDRLATHRATCGICGEFIYPGQWRATYSAEEPGEDFRRYYEHQACADLSQVEQWEDVFTNQEDMPLDIQHVYANACHRLDRVPQLPHSPPRVPNTQGD